VKALKFVQPNERAFIDLLDTLELFRTILFLNFKHIRSASVKESAAIIKSENSTI